MNNRTIYLLSVLSSLLVGCHRLNSLTTIQPGRRFELGGNRNGAFTARLQNVGRVPVEITERRGDGTSVAMGTFRPGRQQTVRFSAGSAALFNNPSVQPAQLRLVVTGDTDLSMRELGNTANNP